MLILTITRPTCYRYNFSTTIWDRPAEEPPRPGFGRIAGSIRRTTSLGVRDGVLKDRSLRCGPYALQIRLPIESVPDRRAAYSGFHLAPTVRSFKSQADGFTGPVAPLDHPLRWRVCPDSQGRPSGSDGELPEKERLTSSSRHGTASQPRFRRTGPAASRRRSSAERTGRSARLD